ncbi:MAG: AAA family ATPase, partial [Pseudomonadota bacterium]
MGTLDKLTRRVREAGAGDIGRGVARLDLSDLKDLNIQIGDLVALHGKQTTYARVMPLRQDDRGDKTLQIDGVIRQNAGIAVGETVEIKAAQAQDAESLTFSFPGRGHYD